MWNGSGGLHVHFSSLLRKQSQKLFCENLLFYEEWTIAGGGGYICLLILDFEKLFHEINLLFFGISVSDKKFLSLDVVSEIPKKVYIFFLFFPGILPLVWLEFLLIFVWPKLEYVKRLAFLCEFFQFSIWCTVRWAHSVLEYKSFQVCCF